MRREERVRWERRGTGERVSRVRRVRLGKRLVRRGRSRLGERGVMMMRG